MAGLVEVGLARDTADALLEDRRDLSRSGLGVATGRDPQSLVVSLKFRIVGVLLGFKHRKLGAKRPVCVPKVAQKRARVAATYHRGNSLRGDSADATSRLVNRGSKHFVGGGLTQWSAMKKKRVEWVLKKGGKGIFC